MSKPEGGDQLMRDALQHIAKTAENSRTQSKRLQWIKKRAELALSGKPFERGDLELPRHGTVESLSNLRIRAVRAEKERNEFAEEIKRLREIELRYNTMKHAKEWTDFGMTPEEFEAGIDELMQKVNK